MLLQENLRHQKSKRGSSQECVWAVNGDGGFDHGPCPKATGTAFDHQIPCKYNEALQLLRQILADSGKTCNLVQGNQRLNSHREDLLLKVVADSVTKDKIEEADDKTAEFNALMEKADFEDKEDCKQRRNGFKLALKVCFKPSEEMKKEVEQALVDGLTEDEHSQYRGGVLPLGIPDELEHKQDFELFGFPTDGSQTLENIWAGKKRACQDAHGETVVSIQDRHPFLSGGITRFSRHVDKRLPTFSSSDYTKYPVSQAQERCPNTVESLAPVPVVASYAIQTNAPAWFAKARHFMTAHLERSRT